MTSRRFSDDLKGPGWDAVRDVRRTVLGNEPGVLDESVVPESFRSLLPYASLMDTGEEGTLEEFWEVMDRAARDAFMTAIAPHVAALRMFAVTRPRSAEKDALLALVRLYTLSIDDWGRRRKKV